MHDAYKNIAIVNASSNILGSFTRDGNSFQLINDDSFEI